MNAVRSIASTPTSAGGALAPVNSIKLIIIAGSLWFAGTSGAQALSPINGKPLEVIEWTNTGAEIDHVKNDAGRGILELRKISGLTWDQLSRLFGVSRRSVHLWASGKPLNSSNEEKLQAILSFIRLIDRGAATENRSALFALNVNGMTPFDLLVRSRYTEAIAMVGTSKTKARPALSPLDADAIAKRMPRTLDYLSGARQDKVHHDNARLLSVSRIKTQRA